MERQTSEIGTQMKAADELSEKVIDAGSLSSNLMSTVSGPNQYTLSMYELGQKKASAQAEANFAS